MTGFSKHPATWQIKHWNGIVSAIAHGPLDLVLVIEKAIETLKGAGGQEPHKFLIDDREATLVLETIEIYQLPATLQRLGLTRDARVAVVYTVNSPSAKDFRFFETVAINQGFQVRVFTSTEAAVEWLKRGENEHQPRQA